MSPSQGRRLLFVSNGHGEDGIAAAIVRALPPGLSAEAYPMIGQGGAYADTCRIVGPRATLASEGWRNVKGSIRRDLATGGLFTIPPALKFFADIRGRYDGLVVVGDMIGVLAALATGHRDLTYLDVYKTGAARLYSRLERLAIARVCSTVYCRADNLAQLLVADGIDARCAGNVMMDTIPTGDYDAQSRRSRPLAVTLLPGSRALTAESFALQIEALRSIPAELMPDIFLAIAGGIDVETLAQAAKLRRTPLLTSEAGDLGQMGDGRLVVHMARGNVLARLFSASDFVMSQAGTATVQALGSGKPVITFANPRDRRSRFRDEQNLFGEARIVCDADVDQVTAAVNRMLTDTAERVHLGEIGRDRIGGPGAMHEIVAALAV